MGSYNLLGAEAITHANPNGSHLDDKCVSALKLLRNISKSRSAILFNTRTRYSNDIMATGSSYI